MQGYVYVFVCSFRVRIWSIIHNHVEHSIVHFVDIGLIDKGATEVHPTQL